MDFDGDVYTILNLDTPAVTLGKRAGSRIRMLYGPTGAAPPRVEADRRRDDRLSPPQTRWSEGAKLRPGHDVRILNIGSRGALIEVMTRLYVGTNAELSLIDAESQARLAVGGIIRRCQVACLDPLVFHGALEFEAPLERERLVPFLDAVGLTT